MDGERRSSTNSVAQATTPTGGTVTPAPKKRVNEEKSLNSITMEEKPPRRKMKFAPKTPPKRVPKQEVKPELVENDNSSAQATELLRRLTVSFDH